jgi:predicted membrane channel-forming protein YqfA (hemolysin III family)
VNRVNNANALAPYEVDLGRSASTMVFAITILCIFVAIAAVGLFVAVQTVRDPRKFQSPLTTWYAAMLFAVVPLRNALPGSPAFGSWIDLTIVLWVLVALVVSMLLYIAAWWRYTSRK